MIADVIRTCLGPKSMLKVKNAISRMPAFLTFFVKMLMDPTGGIVMTNDGNAILREVSENFYLFIYLLFIIN